MSLPEPWVDRIFEKLTLAWGRTFLGRWEGLDLAAVKADWGVELAGFSQRPSAIGWALQHLPPDKPLTALQFRDLCRSAPQPEVMRLPQPKADPARVAEELARLAPLRQAAAPATDHRAWARRILEHHRDGARIAPTPLRMARQALGVEG